MKKKVIQLIFSYICFVKRAIAYVNSEESIAVNEILFWLLISKLEATDISSQQIFYNSKSTIETLEKGVKYLSNKDTRTT